MHIVKKLIFDFDGTLADTSALIVSTMQKSIMDYGLPFRTEEQIKSTIGVRLEEIPHLLWPSYRGLEKSFAMVYRKNFEKLKDRIPVDLFPEVGSTLSLLKENGYRMCIATSRSHRSVEELNRQLGISPYIHYIVGGDDVTKGKPDPESINRIITAMHWDTGETMMIGDMPVDIMMGRNAGVHTCGVTYGNGSEKDLVEAGAGIIINTFGELSRKLVV